jgi:hypothetical protein
LLVAHSCAFEDGHIAQQPRLAWADSDEEEAIPDSLGRLLSNQASLLRLDAKGPGREERNYFPEAIIHLLR